MAHVQTKMTDFYQTPTMVLKKMLRPTTTLEEFHDHVQTFETYLAHLVVYSMKQCNITTDDVHKIQLLYPSIVDATMTTLYDTVCSNAPLDAADDERFVKVKFFRALMASGGIRDYMKQWMRETHVDIYELVRNPKMARAMYNKMRSRINPHWKSYQHDRDEEVLDFVQAYMNDWLWNRPRFYNMVMTEMFAVTDEYIMK